MNIGKTRISEVVYETPIFRILRERTKAANGQQFPHYFVMDTTPGVIIVPETKKQSLLFVRQYRQGIKEVLLEFPAGTQEEAETLQEAAERELMEETGVIAKTILMIGKVVPNPSLSNQFSQVYIAQGIDWVIQKQPNQSDIIEVVEIPIQEAIAKVKTGEIWASDTIAALFMYVQKYHQNKKW